MAAEHTVGAAKWNSEEDKRRREGKDEERRGAVIGARWREEDRLAAPGWGGRWLPTSPLGDNLHVSSGKKLKCSAYLLRLRIPAQTRAAERGGSLLRGLRTWRRDETNLRLILIIVLTAPSFLSYAAEPGGRSRLWSLCKKKTNKEREGKRGKKRERNATQESRAPGSYCAADCINWIAERI